jgi:hypothetical protein
MRSPEPTDPANIDNRDEEDKRNGRIERIMKERSLVNELRHQRQRHRGGR